jgi:hypothetical protein
MSSPVRCLGDSLDRSLRALGSHPAVLTGLLVVLNALFIPYLGIIHDAQIYYGLVLNRIEPDLLSHDLFFQFGSQDQYSLFSPLVAPVAAAIGMKAAFFLGYLASVTLFLAALVRLVNRLWPESPAAVVGLVFLATVEVAYGGYVPLHVIEPFLSARMPACALTIWAFAEVLDRRWMRGGLCLAFAFAIHPLMTFPGLLLLALVALARRWGGWAVAALGVAAALAFGGLLAYRPLALRLFGHFDSEWLALTQQTNGYQFPQEWSPAQWIWNLFALTGLLAAAGWSRRENPDRARVLTAAAAIGAAGLFGALVFTQLPYALLMKGQAYRWLWLPLALTPPALLDLAWNAWRTGDLKYRVGSAMLLLGLGTTSFVPLEYACAFAFAPVILYGFHVFAKEWTWSDKISRALLASVLAGAAIWGGYRLWIFLFLCDDAGDILSLQEQIAVLLGTLGPGIILPILLAAFAAAGARLVGPGRA